MNAPVMVVSPSDRRISAITRVDDQEFTPAVLDQLETPRSPLRRATLVLIVLMGASAIAWSMLAGMDKFVVASGRVQSGGRSRVVQPLEAGKVERVLVHNGSKVSKSEPLFFLDPTLAEEERRAAAAQFEAFEAELSRRVTEIDAIRSGAPCCPTVPFLQSIGQAARERELNLLAADLAEI